MGAIAVRLSPRARLTRPLFATAPQYSDTLLGKEHNCAVPSLAFKWTRIMYRRWKDQTPYPEHQHLEALRKRRSPVLEFCH